MNTSGLATLLVSQIGFGGTLGFLLGYGLKKVAALVFKIVALVSALFMLFLTWLASLGVISVNFNAFANAAGNTFANSLTAAVGSLAFIA
ncbi:MAG TPA: FUN14 domain-containing protein, partial [archaeon]|nr:FUN14 domain-containing protein [archaeon]